MYWVEPFIKVICSTLKKLQGLRPVDGLPWPCSSARPSSERKVSKNILKVYVSILDVCGFVKDAENHWYWGLKHHNWRFMDYYRFIDVTYYPFSFFLFKYISILSTLKGLSGHCHEDSILKRQPCFDSVRWESTLCPSGPGSSSLPNRNPILTPTLPQTLSQS